MYEWTLTAILAKIRQVTGERSAANPTDATLTNEVNQFYQNELPRLLEHSEFHDWFTFSAADGDTGQYTIDALDSSDGKNILALESNYITVDKDPITVYTDRLTFFSLWPESTTHTKAQPTDALIEGRSLWLRPPPDATYEVKIPVTRKIPAALSAGSDKPLDESWGPLIAYGAAKNRLNEQERDTSSAMAGLKYHLGLARRDEIHRLSSQRAAPKY